MLQALGERGVTPDLLVGSSAGALNAAFVAGHGTGRAALEELGGLWRSLRRRDVFLLRPVQGVLALAGRRTSLFSADPLRRLVEANLGYDDLLEARIALHLISTDLSSGREVVLSRGSAVSAVLASAAIPGVFPPVPHQGQLLVDGCITQHTAIRHAVELGADVVYLLPTGYPCALPDSAPVRGRHRPAGPHAAQPATARRRGQPLHRAGPAQGAPAALPAQRLRGRLQPGGPADHAGTRGRRVLDRRRRPGSAGSPAVPRPPRPHPESQPPRGP